MRNTEPLSSNWTKKQGIVNDIFDIIISFIWVQDLDSSEDDLMKELWEEISKRNWINKNLSSKSGEEVFQVDQASKGFWASR